MDFATYISRGIYAFNALAILVLCVVFVVRRCIWKCSKRGFLPTYASAGNALQVLQTMVQPKVEYVLAEKLEEDSEEDDEGDPFDPTKRLQRQLKQIRLGKCVDQLTTYRP
jgi:hypothetical protein